MPLIAESIEKHDGITAPEPQNLAKVVGLLIVQGDQALAEIFWQKHPGRAISIRFHWWRDPAAIETSVAYGRELRARVQMRYRAGRDVRLSRSGDEPILCRVADMTRQ